MKLGHILQLLADKNQLRLHFISERLMRVLSGRSEDNFLWVESNHLNSLRPRQNGCLLADDTFKRIFLNENIRISTKNSLKFVLNGLINNIPALLQITAWRRPGDKPLSESMMASLLTQICVTRPHWVNCLWVKDGHTWLGHNNSNYIKNDIGMCPC